MSYDDLKEFDGEGYSGMAVGGRHLWHYTDALWREEKVAPDAWEFTLTSVKRRDRPAPPGSGAAVFSEYHWYVVAHQWARKIDADSYSTFMSGMKYKVAHKRPHWRAWSTDYPGSTGEGARVSEILEAELARVKESRETAPALALAEAWRPRLSGTSRSGCSAREAARASPAASASGGTPRAVGPAAGADPGPP